MKEPSQPYTYANSDDEEDPDEFEGDAGSRQSENKNLTWSQVASKKALTNDSALEQVSRAISSVHMNQRVLSTKVIFTEQNINKQRFDPTLTIDGIQYVGDSKLGALEEITITRAFKY